MKFKAKKLVGTEQIGDYLTERYHVLHLELDSEKVDDIWENEADDSESAYYHGLGGDMDGELYFIMVDDFLTHCDLMKDDEDEIELKIRDYQYFLDKLKDFKGYTLYVMIEESGK